MRTKVYETVVEWLSGLSCHKFNLIINLTCLITRGNIGLKVKVDKMIVDYLAVIFKLLLLCELCSIVSGVFCKVFFYPKVKFFYR